MRTLARGLVFGGLAGALAFGLAIVEGFIQAFGAAAGSISPSSYLAWGVVPVVGTACLSRFIGRKEAAIAAIIVLGVVLRRCETGYEEYLKEGGVWALAALQWRALMIPVAALSISFGALAVVVLPKRKRANHQPFLTNALDRQ